MVPEGEGEVAAGGDSNDVRNIILLREDHGVRDLVGVPPGVVAADVVGSIRQLLFAYDTNGTPPGDGLSGRQLVLHLLELHEVGDGSHGVVVFAVRIE